MKPCDFDYIRATSVAQVLELLGKSGGGAKILAGGQSLVAALNMRLSAPELLIDISELEEMRGIEMVDGRLRIGATTCHADVQRSGLVVQHAPLLKSAMDHVAHAAIRNRGTHGGSIAFADPAAEIPACAVALDARFIIRNPDGERTVAARDFFHDLYETDMQENEILVAVEYPPGGPGDFVFFREFARRKGDFATAGLALHAERAGDRFKRLAPVFFGVANTPVLAEETAGILVNRPLTTVTLQAAQEALGNELNVIGDMYAGAGMKLHLAEYFLKQAIEEMINQT